MPWWDLAIKNLANVAKVAEKIEPATKALAQKIVPMTKDRWVVALDLAKTQKMNPGQLEKLEAILPSMSASYMSHTKKIPFNQAYDTVMAKGMTDLNEMPGTVREVAEQGRKGKIPPLPEPPIKGGGEGGTAGTSNVRYQAQMKRMDAKKAKYESLGQKDKVKEIDAAREQLASMMEGQTVVRELPWRYKVGTTGVSPLFRESYAFGTGNALTFDIADVTAFKDRFLKTTQPWWRAFTGKNGPGGGFKSLQHDKKFEADMAQALIDSWPQTEQYYKLASNMQNLVNKYNSALKTGGGAGVAAAEEAAAPYLKSINKLKPKVLDALVDMQYKRWPLYKKYLDQPDFRIALYREAETRPLVEKLMKPGEKVVAEGHKKLMGDVRDLLVKYNIPVLGQDKDYVTHLWKRLLDKKVDKVTFERMNRFLPSIIKFQQRNPGSANLFPSIHASTEAYLPMAANKIAGTALMSKWKNIVEKDLVHWPEAQKAVKAHLEQFMNKSMDENFWEKAMRQLTWWTYFTKVGLSVPVAFKHMMKMGYLVATNPRDSLAVIPKALKGSMELALQRFGVKPGPTARIMRNFNIQRNVFEDVAGLAGATDLMGKAHRITNIISGSPVYWVEAFERYLSTAVAMNKAARKGLSYKQMHQAIWGGLLDASFIGRANNFLWLNKPWQRFMAIFAFTPGMMIDRTLRLASRGTSMEQFITGMKAGVLETGKRMPRDVFGTPYAKHLIAFGTLIGAAELYAQYHGVKPWWASTMMAGHPPASITKPIPVEIAKTAQKRGGQFEDWVSTLTDFFTATPALDRMKQQWRGELTKVSGGDELFHALGIPSAKAAKQFEEMEKKFGGREFGYAWQRKTADKRREKTLLGPLYNEAIKPWLRRP